MTYPLYLQEATEAPISQWYCEEMKTRSGDANHCVFIYAATELHPIPLKWLCGNTARPRHRPEARLMHGHVRHRIHREEAVEANDELAV